MKQLQDVVRHFTVSSTGSRKGKVRPPSPSLYISILNYMAQS